MAQSLTNHSRLIPAQLSALSNWENLPPGLARFGQQAINSGTLNADVLNSLLKTFSKLESMDVKSESNS